MIICVNLMLKIKSNKFVSNLCYALHSSYTLTLQGIQFDMQSFIHVTWVKFSFYCLEIVQVCRTCLGGRCGVLYFGDTSGM